MQRRLLFHWLSSLLQVACARAAFVSGLLCLASGCVQGPNYSRPPIVVPSAYRFSGLELRNQRQSATRDWWMELADKQLNDLVQEALVNNRDLRVAAARVDEFTAILAGTNSQ